MVYDTVGLLEFPHIRQSAGDRRGHCHGRAHQMGAPSPSLPPLEIAVRGRGAALAWLESVGVHRKAHGAAGLAPFEAGLEEDVVQTLGLRLLFDKAGARYDHRADMGRHLASLRELTFDDLRRVAQILDPPIGAGADEGAIDL